MPLSGKYYWEITVNDMAPRTWKMEITCDFMTKTQNETMDALFRLKAREVLSQAMLLADRRQPEMVLMVDDNFEPTREIMLLDEEENDGSPEAVARAAEGAKTANAQWARSQGYTVADKDGGWRYNNPDGIWSHAVYPTEDEAWEAAFVLTQ